MQDFPTHKTKDSVAYNNHFTERIRLQLVEGSFKQVKVPQKSHNAWDDVVVAALECKA